MTLQLVLTLLRAFLDLSRKWSRRPLHWLLRILSALSVRRRNSPLVTSNNDRRSKQTIGAPSLADHEGVDCCNSPERPVALACSSTPRKPPPARSYTRHTSSESYQMGPTRTSPASTLRELPITTSPASSPTHDRRDLTRGLPSPPEIVTAEPAGFVAPPVKPFQSFLPSRTSRYDRGIVIGNDLGPWLFKPLETVTVYDELDVPYWTHHVQPEGQLYFHNVSRRFNYLTEENLSEPATLAEAELFVTIFERRAENFKTLPYNVEVVFEMHKKFWRYYMVDLDRRSLFWIDDCIVDDSVLLGDFGVEHREHFRNMFEFEYWQHIDYFPNHRHLQEGLLEELLGMLIQQHIDMITSLTSTSGFGSDELKAVIGSVKNMQSLQTSEIARPYVIQSSARMMAVIANERFFNFFGFHGVRLSPCQSVRGEDGNKRKKKRSPLITLVSPILFYAPEIHLGALENVWVDSVVKVRLWKVFQSKIERDWEGFILYATVLVNANVAFLAIPNVISDDLAAQGLVTSPAAIVSQISIVTSLGSIIIGLLLVRQMRIGAKDSCEDYLTFLENRSHPQLGLETLAILYSLPYSLLIWGMSTFLSAVAITCFYNMGGDVTLFKQIIYGIVWLFVITFILWTIQTGWEKKRRSEDHLSTSYVSSDSNPSSPSSSTSSSPPVDSEPGKSGTSEEAERGVSDARSVRSKLTASSTLASSMGHSWRSRVRKVADHRPKRSAWSWPWSLPWTGGRGIVPGAGDIALQHRTVEA